MLAKNRDLVEKVGKMDQISLFDQDLVEKIVRMDQITSGARE